MPTNLEMIKAMGLIQDLTRALQDHHTGMNTTRLFNITYDRDQDVIDRAQAWMLEEHLGGNRETV